jgi:HTH-type transcriptional regulator, quorum sensing regulator NprR
MLKTSGERIKYLRVLKHMKQSDLAKGICSVSYLSKIENNVINPSHEVENLLMKRLGLSEEVSNSNNELHTKLKKWHTSLLGENIEEATSQYNEISLKISNKVDYNLFIRYKIYSLSYFLLVGDLNSAKEVIHFFKGLNVELTGDLKILCLQYWGVYDYLSGQYTEAYVKFTNAVDHHVFNHLDSIHQAHLYYYLALSSGKTNQQYECIKFAEESLKRYQNKYFLKNCVNCHILLGIAFRRELSYKESLNHYNSAKDIVKVIDYPEIEAIIHHNMGTLYGIIGQSGKAIDYFLESIHFAQANHQNKSKSILALIAEYIRFKKLPAAQHWVSEGKKIITNQKLQEELILYEHLINEDFQLAEKVFNKNVKQQLVKDERFSLISYIYLIFGDYWMNQGKFKKASSYYLFSREYLAKSYTHM